MMTPLTLSAKELGAELGVAETYKKTPVGVFFGEAGRTVPDPFFGGRVLEDGLL